MRFEIDAKDLAKALSNLARNTATEVQVFRFLQISAKDKMIRLSTTNGITTMTYDLNADNVEGNKDTLINAKKFYEVVSKLDGMLSFNDGVIKCGKSRFKIPVAYEDFIKDTEEFELMELDAPNFIKTLEKRLFACAKYTNNVLSGVLLNVNEICTTDGNVMSVGKCTCSDKPIVISENVAKEICNCFEYELFVGVSKNKVRFSGSNITLTSNILDGEFPPYKQLIPISYEHDVRVNKKSILNALTLILTAVEDRTGLCIFKFEKNALKLSAMSSDNEGYTEIKINYTDEPIEIGFNINYMINCLKNLDAEEVLFRFNTPDKAIVITADTDIHVLMPIVVRK